MDTSTPGVGAATMHDQHIVMVAERAVRDTVNQGINDLRGELGIKFHEIENAAGGIKSMGIKIGEIENDIDNLNLNITEAFKKNNAMLRNEIQALKGDLSEEFKNKMTKALSDNQEQITKTRYVDDNTNQMFIRVDSQSEVTKLENLESIDFLNPAGE